MNGGSSKAGGILKRVVVMARNEVDIHQEMNDLNQQA
jgi:hypothetical protein